MGWRELEVGVLNLKSSTSKPKPKSKSVVNSIRSVNNVSLSQVYCSKINPKNSVRYVEGYFIKNCLVGM